MKMPTGYEADNHRNLDRIANALERIADSLDEVRIDVEVSGVDLIDAADRLGEPLSTAVQDAARDIVRATHQSI